jgi:protocatechuate 3,4-dioxygenase beta subunit
MKQSVVILSFIVVLFSEVGAESRNARLVGGPCEGCEAVFEYGERGWTSVDTLPNFNNNGSKIKGTGTIYQNDGKTPAEHVILYIYHTDQEGIYATRGGETGWGRRHGFIRGWAKTDSAGRYTFYTLKPGIYPNRSELLKESRRIGIGKYYDSGLVRAHNFKRKLRSLSESLFGFFPS